MRPFTPGMREFTVPRLTVTIDEDHEEILEAKSGDGGPYESKSEAVRMFIEEYETTHERIEELERTVDRLRNEKQAIIEQREENQELARYVDEERTWRQAGIVTRTKWWLLGKPESA